MTKQGSEHTDQEILESLKQDIADINARIDMLWGVLSDQHEINMLQRTINLILTPKREDEVMH